MGMLLPGGFSSKELYNEIMRKYALSLGMTLLVGLLWGACEEEPTPYGGTDGAPPTKNDGTTTPTDGVAPDNAQGPQDGPKPTDKPGPPADKPKPPADKPRPPTDKPRPPVDKPKPPDKPPAGCSVFPANNPWNTDISSYSVHKNSAKYVANIGASESLHPDFGTVWAGAPNGIPYVIVPGNQPKVPIKFTDYPSESDPGPYPIPKNAPIEGGPNGTDDRHVIAVDMTNCMLYELFYAFPVSGGKSWKASSGAIFNMKSNKLRKIGWTSADAAGLPIFPGLVRYEEVKAGAIKHALRFTVVKSQKAYVLPATHWASSSTDPNRPPMGLRFRLKKSFNISGYSKDNQVILTALKKYGMIMADNGGDWFLSGAPNSKWNDSDLHKLKQVKGSDFEVVDTGPIKTSY